MFIDTVASATRPEVGDGETQRFSLAQNLKKNRDTVHATEVIGQILGNPSPSRRKAKVADDRTTRYLHGGSDTMTLCLFLL